MRHVFRLLVRNTGQRLQAAPVARAANTRNGNAKWAKPFAWMVLGATASFATFEYYHWDKRLPGTLSHGRPRVYASDSATLKVRFPVVHTGGEPIAHENTRAWMRSV